MPDQKSILIAVDGSPHSFNAVQIYSRSADILEEAKKETAELL